MNSQQQQLQDMAARLLLAEEKASKYDALVAKSEAKKAEAKLVRAIKATDAVKAHRAISGIGKLNVPKEVAVAIASYDTEHKRYNNCGDCFQAISNANNLEFIDPRKFHIAKSIDETSMYMYHSKKGNDVMVFVSISMKGYRQFHNVDAVGQKLVYEYLSKIPPRDRIID